MTVHDKAMANRRVDNMTTRRRQLQEERRQLLRKRGEVDAALKDLILPHALSVLEVVESVEARCMAADGPVTPTLQEMEEGELRRLWLAAKSIAAIAQGLRG